MRLFMGMLYTESNTASPLATGWAAFKDGGLAYGAASQDPQSAIGIVLAEWRAMAAAAGVTVIEGTAAAAQPGGRTLRSVYESLRDSLLAEIRAAGPLDMILLYLHGAMSAVGYDDCEGDLLAGIREITGARTVVGCELDLHCHLTQAMMENANVLIAYKEYPHTDEVDRARELFTICHDAAMGRTQPVMALFDCKMISMWRTTQEPMRGFVDRLQALEGRDGILSITFGHGFPWGDVADVGARMLVVSDGDKDKAMSLARRLGLEIYAMREATRPTAIDVGTALDRAQKLTPGPVVLGDVADNPGGGAPGDSTFILAACVERGLHSVAIGCLWDPGAVALCHEAGLGASFRLRIGGKLGATSGQPVDLDVTVRALSDDHHQTGLGGDRVSLGHAAWVEADGIDIILVTRREQTFSPDAFTGLGLDPASREIVVVKSTQHFHANFSPLAKEVLYVATPGAIPPDFATMTFTKRDGNFWPRVADPLGQDR
ncbi:MAG TPA: M81 family metallopeptidase [Rhizomicrobium sp.]|nr:M81 family metallopeptidase [Rhizomicrobium sp.]